MVINCMIAALMAKNKKNLTVYHVGSSRQNPLTFAETKCLMNRYLTKNPLLDGKGNPIKVGKPKTLNTMPKFHTYICIHYMPFLKVTSLLIFI